MPEASATGWTSPMVGIRVIQQGPSCPAQTTTAPWTTISLSEETTPPSSEPGALATCGSIGDRQKLRRTRRLLARACQPIQRTQTMHRSQRCTHAEADTTQHATLREEQPVEVPSNEGHLIPQPQHVLDALLLSVPVLPSLVTCVKIRHASTTNEISAEVAEPSRSSPRLIALYEVQRTS